MKLAPLNTLVIKQEDAEVPIVNCTETYANETARISMA